MEAGINAWGTSWGAAWGDSWGSQQLIVIDTHDGGERKRRREFREDKERLHTQLESAFESAFNKSGKPILRPAISSIEPDDDEDWLILL